MGKLSVYIYSWKFPDISLTCFCKIPWFYPDFTHFYKFPDFSMQGIFFNKIPCFPWFFPVVGTLFKAIFSQEVPKEGM